LTLRQRSREFVDAFELERTKEAEEVVVLVAFLLVVVVVMVVFEFVAEGRHDGSTTTGASPP
jgi:hypothetical protein